LSGSHFQWVEPMVSSADNWRLLSESTMRLETVTKGKLTNPGGIVPGRPVVRAESRINPAPSSVNTRRQSRTDLPNPRRILQISKICFGGEARPVDRGVQPWLHHRKLSRTAAFTGGPPRGERNYHPITGAKRRRGRGVRWSYVSLRRQSDHLRYVEHRCLFSRLCLRNSN
jgi:hypothetical protein